MAEIEHDCLIKIQITIELNYIDRNISMTSSHRLAAVPACFLLSIALMVPLQAADYDELETRPGLAENNTRWEAEAIATTLFTAPEPGEVFERPDSFTATVHGTSGWTPEPHEIDIDFFSFSTRSTSVAMFDIDGVVDGNVVQTLLALFDADGNLIAFGDDMNQGECDPGSNCDPFPFDAFIGEITLAPGNYFIAVSQEPNFPDPAYQSLCYDSEELVRPDGKYGGNKCTGGVDAFPYPAYSLNDPSLEGSYRLHISLQPKKAKFMPWLPLLLE
jgi:hypothetical protein